MRDRRRTVAPAGLRRALARALAVTGLGVLPLVLTAEMLRGAIGHRYGFDYHGAFWEAGRDVLAGRSPYPAPTVAALSSGDRFVYPPPLLLALLPLALLPFPVAAALVTVGLVAALGAALWVLDVRDARVYGAVLLCPAVEHDLRLGAITPLLALGLALAWSRRGTRVGTIALAAVVVAKLFLWPLLVWLVLTRRSRSAFGGGLLALAAAGAGWAAIGFAGLREYPRLLAELARLEQDRGYSLVAASGRLLGPGGARVVPFAVGALLLVLAAVVARRGDGDRRAFTLCLAAALALSPVVWLHYLILLVVPLAIARPRLTPLWLVPAALWLSPFEENLDSGLRIAVVLVVVGVLVAALLTTSPVGGRRRRSVVFGRPEALGSPM